MERTQLHVWLQTRWTEAFERHRDDWAHNQDPARTMPLTHRICLAKQRLEQLAVNPWAEAWGNGALAKEAAQLTLAWLGKEDTRVYDGDVVDAVHKQGPSHLPDARELFRTLYSVNRSERKEHLEMPPGVGV